LGDLLQFVAAVFGADFLRRAEGALVALAVGLEEKQTRSSSGSVGDRFV
jgi:hypothetical protein